MIKNTEAFNVLVQQKDTNVNALLLAPLAEFEPAILGLAKNGPEEKWVAVYDREKCIATVQRLLENTREEAEEYFMLHMEHGINWSLMDGGKPLFVDMIQERKPT